MRDVELKDKEIEKRKKINIDDQKRIEELKLEIRRLQQHGTNLEDDLEVWKFRYSNQELIKKYGENENFRESYLNLMMSSQPFKLVGRL